MLSKKEIAEYLAIPENTIPDDTVLLAALSHYALLRRAGLDRTEAHTVALFAIGYCIATLRFPEPN